MEGEELEGEQSGIRIPTELPTNGKRKRAKKKEPGDQIFSDAIAYVKTVYPSGQEVEDRERIGVRVFVTRPETLHLEYERTFHLGDRSYAKITVGIFSPHYVEERDAAFKDATSFLAERMLFEAASLVQYQQQRDSKIKGGDESPV
jgi:hypothetical protein